MWDASVPMIELAMEAPALTHLPECPLPAPYRWRGFQPGDEVHWARIEASALEFSAPADGLARFRREFPDGAELGGRMLFLTDGGAPFATATAWRAADGRGHLHYVAIDAEHQGRGLCRPLVYLALKRMAELGHARAFLTTQTASWVAIRVYWEFGFRPIPLSGRDREGWEIVSQKTGIDMKLN